MERMGRRWRAKDRSFYCPAFTSSGLGLAAPSPLGREVGIIGTASSTGSADIVWNFRWERPYFMITDIWRIMLDFSVLRMDNGRAEVACMKGLRLCIVSLSDVTSPPPRFSGFQTFL